MTILDRKSLHPFGGYCTCFTRPYAVCQICKALAEQTERWNALTPEERAEAEAELFRQYPRTSNQDGR